MSPRQQILLQSLELSFGHTDSLSLCVKLGLSSHRPYLCPSVIQHFCLSDRQSVCLSVGWSVIRSDFSPAYLSVGLCVCVNLLFYLLISLSFCPCVCLTSTRLSFTNSFGLSDSRRLSLFVGLSVRLCVSFDLSVKCQSG